MAELFSNFGEITWQMVVMWLIGALLIYLAIKKDMEPALLLPMGFGAILVNIPFSGAVGPDGALSILFDAGIANELFPLILFIGIGAMIDFGPLLSNPKMMLFGAAAQFGIFITFSLSRLFGFALEDAAATAIIGAPNAGKSSLLNALVGFDRAIVTDIAGTTRDTVEEKATVGGVLLRLIDTAGLHETDDLVEQLGVERSKKAVEDADLILALLDGSTGLPASEARAAEMLAPLELAAKSGKPWLLLLTKSDLGGGAGIVPDKDWRTPEAIISLSSVTHEGFEALEAAIRTLYPAPKGDTSLVTNARQADAIRRALDSVRAAKDALQSGMTPDVVLTEVEQAENALGELTGRTAREDMVARIFERFCVGK